MCRKKRHAQPAGNKLNRGLLTLNTTHLVKLWYLTKILVW